MPGTLASTPPVAPPVMGPTAAALAAEMARPRPDAMPPAHDWRSMVKLRTLEPGGPRVVAVVVYMGGIICQLAEE